MRLCYSSHQKRESLFCHPLNLELAVWSHTLWPVECYHEQYEHRLGKWKCLGACPPATENPHHENKPRWSLLDNESSCGKRISSRRPRQPSWLGLHSVQGVVPSCGAHAQPVQMRTPSQPTGSWETVFVVLKHCVLWWCLTQQKLTNIAPLTKHSFHPEFCPQGNLQGKLWGRENFPLETPTFYSRHCICLSQWFYPSLYPPALSTQFLDHSRAH